ncbi:hypothetical protein RCL1_008936 [Eukaryota sp. TZLM3-RCL]
MNNTSDENMSDEQKLDFSTSTQILKEALAVFSDDTKDVSSVIHLKEILSTAKSLSSQREQELRRQIASLTTSVSKFEQDLKAATTADNIDRINDLQQQLSSLQADHNSILQHKSRLTSSLNESQLSHSSLCREYAAQRDSALNRTIPQVRTYLALYDNITALTWNYKSDSISGSIHHDKRRPIAFDFNKEANPVETANQLWSLIDS